MKLFPKKSYELAGPYESAAYELARHPCSYPPVDLYSCLNFFRKFVGDGVDRGNSRAECFDNYSLSKKKFFLLKNVCTSKCTNQKIIEQSSLFLKIISLDYNLSFIDDCQLQCPNYLLNCFLVFLCQTLAQSLSSLQLTKELPYHVR